jgi:hypothetical protein
MKNIKVVLKMITPQNRQNTSQKESGIRHNLDAYGPMFYTHFEFGAVDMTCRTRVTTHT